MTEPTPGVSSAAPRSRPRRAIDGVLLLDKPVGPSSSRVLGHVKHLLQAAKAGHGGTLDPLASGLLPVMFGEATKYAAEGLDADKTYLAEIALGQKTSTGDREGQVIEQALVPEGLSAEQIESMVETFRGPQQQIPPMFSAVKKEGKALYHYARTGQDVARAPRQIVIHDIRLVSFASPCLTVQITCSKGTYVRTLAEDMGRALGLPAHLKSLRRIGVGSLLDHDVIPLEKIEQANEQERLSMLKPVDWLIRDWPQVVLGQAQQRRFVHGQPVSVSADGGLERVRVRNEAGEFLGTGRVDAHHVLTPERVRVLTS